MEWGTPVYWGMFLLFCGPQTVKTKEINPTRPGSPTPCKQALNKDAIVRSFKKCEISLDLSGSENNEINIEGIPDYKKQDIKIQSVTLGEWLSDRFIIQGDRLIQVARNTVQIETKPQIETFISGVLMICENKPGNP